MYNIEALKEICCKEWRAFYLTEGRNLMEVEAIQLARACHYTDALEIVTGKEWYYNCIDNEMQISTLNK